MSMKRAKQVNRSRNKDSDDPPWMSAGKPVEKKYDYKKDVAGQPDESFAAYAMSQKFAAGALILHPKFGKGVVVKVAGPRIEVLFEDGPKTLGHAG